MSGAEEWRPTAFSIRYEVSSLGRVRRDGTLLKPNVNPRTRYLQLSMYDRGARTTKPVHRLVGEAFLGPRPDELETRHLNGDRFDNRLGNLTYGTHSENMVDQVRHGGHYWASRPECPSGHPYDEANTVITPNGRRQCRACRYAQSIESNQRTRDKRIADGWDPDAYRNRGVDGVRKPPPSACGNGHDLTGENLRMVNGDPTGKWACRTCERAASDRYRARRRGVVYALPVRQDVAA